MQSPQNDEYSIPSIHPAHHPSQFMKSDAYIDDIEEEDEIDPPPAVLNSQTKHQQKLQQAIIALIAAAIVVWVWVTLGYLQTNAVSEPVAEISPNQPALSHETSTSSQSSPLPRILWILTDRNLTLSRLQPTFYGHHLSHYGNKSGFQVRLVDHESAYRWLSQQTRDMVTKAMHGRRYEVNVGEFLRLALLIEHGGIVIRPGSAIVIETFDWILPIFTNNAGTDATLECSLYEPPELFMFSQDDRYVDFFLAGRRNSSLLWKIFKEMGELVRSGRDRYPVVRQMEVVNAVTNASGLNKPFEVLMNSYFERDKRLEDCKANRLQSIDATHTISSLLHCPYPLQPILKLQRSSAIEQCNLKWLIALQGLQSNITKLFRKAIANGTASIGKYHTESIINQDFFELEGIRPYLEPIGKRREVELCVVSLGVIPKAEVDKKVGDSLKKLKTQSFKKWNAVYFTEGGAETIKTDNRTSLNLQTAITQHCPPKSIVLLLDHNEHLPTPTSLSELALPLSDRSIYGALLPLQLPTSRLTPSLPTVVHRTQFQPNPSLLSTISNHFRLFHRDYYRLLSHNDLHNVQGEYYDRTIPLLALLEMSAHMDICRRESDVFETKAMRRIMDFPERRVTLTVPIVTNTYRRVDSSRPEYHYKFSYLTFCSAVKAKTNNDNWLWVGKEMLVFNRGTPYLSPSMRGDKPKVIPRKIHQIWLQGEPTAAKRYMMDQLRLLHPEFQYFLWSRDNITAANFPLTHTILQTLLEFDPSSPYSKLAMVCDFMRLEIVYRHGGFYLDTNYLWLGKDSLENWRSYHLVLGGELYPRMYLMASNSFFGSYPHNPRFLRLLNPESINRVRIYDKHAGIVSGPGFIKHLVVGQDEENDVDLLKPSMEELFPYYPFDEMTKENRCRVDGEGKEKGLGEEIMFVEGGYGFRKNCGELYPSAYGIDFYELGGSWLRRKKL